VRLLTVAASALAALAAGTGAWLAHSAELSLSIEDLESPSFSARGLSARLSGPAFRELALDVKQLRAAGREWRNVKLACTDLETKRGRVTCTRGTLDAGQKIPLAFSYGTDTKDFVVELKPQRDETWRANGSLGGPDIAVDAKLENLKLDRFSGFLPKDLPKLTAGRASGSLQLRGGAVVSRLELAGVAFGDATGLHAGDKVGAAIEVDATSKGEVWTWNTRIDWRAGEVFWNPFFLSAQGQRLTLGGATAHGRTELRTGSLHVPQIGDVAFSGRWDHGKGALIDAQASAPRIRVGPLYEQIMKPLLAETALSDLRAEGEVSVSVVAAGDSLASVDAELHSVSFEDRQRRRFGVFGANGRIPWRRSETTTAEIAFKGAEVLKVAIGAVRIPMRVRTNSVAIASVRVPVLDGALQLRDFAAGRTADGWRWRFAGEVEPISMARLTQALALPAMHGALSGTIPEVRYRRQILSVDGALRMNVFDGNIAVSKLELIEPFGRAPRLNAEIDMKTLDLELLTRTFDFGTITGRLDATVRGLELSNWEPVRFDTRMASSAGTYPRKISQRAVQNISALGGAGAAAAIQRSLLRFFDQFGYDRLGLSCRLENGVCEMDGIERAPQGYVIVKGGGVPAISVIGYNRSVSWRELVDRLKRITQDNVKPIVK
jgi:hypothetical protein